MTKELSKAIMIRNKLQCHFLEEKKKRTSQAKPKYSKQRNLRVSWIRKSKMNYYESLDLNDINDNEMFLTSLQQSTTLFCSKI